MGAAMLVAGGMLAFAQSLPNEPRRGSGASVTAAFEGWFRNPDGSFSLLVGYYNRNQAQELDLPIGSNNKLEPGAPDRGQPTHFRTGRHGLVEASIHILDVDENVDGRTAQRLGTAEAHVRMLIRHHDR